MSRLTRRREDAKDEEALAGIVIDTAMQIHMELGPGLLETVYEVVLADELVERGLRIERQVDVPVRYRDKVFAVGFRADLLVENKVCVELKSLESLAPVHAKQLLTYLRLLDFRLGLLVNFGAPLLKDGLKRVANGLISSKYPSSLRVLAPSRDPLQP